jgi:cytoskeletal protein RodZ
MAFTDMNDIENELGEEKPPERNGNRTFLIVAGTLGGIMVLALLCIAGLALYRYLPSQQAAQQTNATQAAQDTANAISASETAFVPTATATRRPTSTQTNTPKPTNTPVVVIVATKSPTLDIAIATRNALLTQTAVNEVATATSVVPTNVTPGIGTSTSRSTTLSPAKGTSTPPRATSTALPGTGIADELGTTGLVAAAFALVMIIFVVRKLRSAL